MSTPDDTARDTATPGHAVDVLAALPVAVAAVDRGGRISFVNPAVERVWGVGPDALLGRHVHDDALDTICNGFAVAAAGVDIAGATSFTMHDDVRDKWCEWTCEAHGSGYLVVGRDVTALRQAELSRRQALAGGEAENAINRRIFETSIDLIFVVNRNGDFIRVSPSAQTVLGYAPAEMVGRNGRDFIHPDDLDSTRAEMRLARKGRLMRNFECRYVHRSGDAVTLTWTGVWSEIEQQHFFIGRDMTERNAAEERLRRAQRLEAVGQMTGGIAHDFNNLLAIIIGNLDLIQEMAGARAETVEPVGAALNAALRSSQLTRHLLAFSRRQSLDASAFDLNEAVTQTLALLGRTLGETVSVRSVLASDIDHAYADPVQFESALTNLAINARDAMPGGGWLTIETDNRHLDEDYVRENPEVTPGKYVMLAVTDTGTGMSAEVLARAFDPFFTTKAPGMGSGLGLSMIYGFARQSQGHVKIYSEAGHGTTVRLYLPAAKYDAAPAGATTREDAPPQTGGERILLVEDNELVRRVVRAQIDRLGYKVVEATTAAEALHVLDADPNFDLLFTDVVMPGGMTGDELAEAAVRLRPGLRVLLTSGFAAGAAQSGARSPFFRNMLGKPYRLTELAMKLRATLDA